MICSSCEGLVIWKGPMSNLTHTECQKCGAINNQIAEQEPCPYCDDEGVDEHDQPCVCITGGE